MRKTVIALIVVLPLLFVFIIFSSVNMASLGVNISANGIKITNKSTFENETIEIDLADKRHVALEVAVQPENATNKDYTFEVAEVEGSDFADVSVDKESGEISATGEGAAKVFAVSNDGGYRDGVTVLVNSSAPYDFDFSMFGVNGTDNLLTTDRNGNYTATVEAGLYAYNFSIKPKSFTESKLLAADQSTIADIDEGLREVLLPFSGRATLNATVPGGVDGDIVKSVILNVRAPQSATGIIINGRAGGATVLAESGARSSTFYIESPSAPEITFEDSRITAEVTSLGGKRYKAEVQIPEGYEEGDRFSAEVISGGKSESVVFNFVDFDYSVRASINLSQGEGGGLNALVQRKKKVTFYAVPAVPADGVTFEWSVSGEASPDILTPSQDGRSCALTANEFGNFVLKVDAVRGGKKLNIPQEISVSVISSVNGVRIVNSETDQTDLAARYTVAGTKYDSAGHKTENKYGLNIKAFNIGGTADNLPRGLDDLDVSVSDASVAELSKEGGVMNLIPKGTGSVTVTAAWKGNYTFGVNISNSLTLNVVKDAVEVSKPSQFMTETRAGSKVTLASDLSIGLNDDGTMMTDDAKKALLGRMSSTYNTAFYERTTDYTLDDSKLSYIVEFKADVYGNGHTVDCDAITQGFVDYTNPDKPSPKYPELYGRPNYFVDYKKGMASVAGQDNCAFLIRTDGVKLYGINLCACKDESLFNNGEYQLSRLNCIGTTLEVNASAEILNCRIRNGRSVLRIYGGNKAGDNYFVKSIDPASDCDGERANVKVEGCVISQGREFLLKIGANRALQASIPYGAEPTFKNENGIAYRAAEEEGSNVYNLKEDEYFYKHYVLTDVTLKDSVLETSGFFTVGIESNFAGNWLYPGTTAEPTYKTMTETWTSSGGTSFASVLRLEGDVRLYDWKDLELVNSDTLIESTMGGLSEWLKLDVANMFNFVKDAHPDKYADVVRTIDGNNFAHGGIAFYGGGINYSQLITDGLDAEFADLSHYRINISILADSKDSNLKREGEMLPKAAGTNDFNFYLYNAASANSYEKQLSDAQSGKKYTGVTKLNLY